MFTTEAIRNIAAKHGYRATLAPRIHADNCAFYILIHLFKTHILTFPSTLQAAAAYMRTSRCTKPVLRATHLPVRTPPSHLRSRPPSAPSCKGFSRTCPPSARSHSPRPRRTRASSMASGQAEAISSGVLTTARSRSDSVGLHAGMVRADSTLRSNAWTRRRVRMLRLRV